MSIRKIFMGDGIATGEAKPLGNWARLNKELALAKAILCQLPETVEGIEDARIIERTESRNRNKPRIPWAGIKKQMQLG